MSQATLSNVDLLARLVGFNSVSSNSNRAIADFIADYLDLPQATVLQLPGGKEGKVNLVARVGGNGEDSGDGLILSGHMDTVPAQEPEWRSDPFQLTETDQGYAGRGAVDMKGFLALACNLFRGCAANPPRRPLALLLSCDEETGLEGAQHFASSWDGHLPLPQRAIVGEPTEMRAVRLHKGHLQMRVTLFGQSAHSAYPHLGRNAIEPAGRVIQALKDLRRRLESERHETSRYYPETPFVSLNIGCIRGGSAVNVVPDRCVIDFGLRVMPGMGDQELIPRIKGALAELSGLGDYRLEKLNLADSLKAAEGSDIHRHLCAAVSQQGTEVVSYASDAGVLQRMGIECVVFGPGSIEVAHKPNEFMPKDEFAAAVPILESAIHRFCRGSC